MSININHPILNTDSYKMSHYLQYPEDAQYISSYIEARGSVDPELTRVMFFGLNIFIRDVLTQRITMPDVEYAKNRVETHGIPFNYEGWKYIVEKHGGYLPIEIKAIPEGQVTPLGTPLVQITNTDAKVPWIVSYLETSLLRAIWYPTTIASKSLRDRKTLQNALLQTTGSAAGAEFMLHDFGARGVSSNESAAIGGLAHLAGGFMGTDTFVALEYAKHYYNEPMAAFSVIASEHSTTTINGEEGECDFFEKMIDLCPKDGIVSVVADSYNIWRAIDDYIGRNLFDKVKALAKIGGRLVVRPDSGDPIAVPVECVEKLAAIFGTTTNEFGYKVLPDYIRVLQGDGIDSYDLKKILRTLESKGFAASNIVFGMGGGLLQKVNRDTLKFAMKCNAWSRDGDNWIDVYKNPISGKKTSKKGHIISVDAEGNYLTTPYVNPGPDNNLLQPVYHYSKDKSTRFAYKPELSEIRKLADETY